MASSRCLNRFFIAFLLATLKILIPPLAFEAECAYPVWGLKMRASAFLELTDSTAAYFEDC
jgi:hypothetical protein